MIDVHALMSTIDMQKLLSKKGANIQVNDLVKAMVASEPCLFSNSKNNLMPVDHSRETTAM